MQISLHILETFESIESIEGLEGLEREPMCPEIVDYVLRASSSESLGSLSHTEVIATIRSNESLSPEFKSDLIRDISDPSSDCGQIGKAISSPAWFKNGESIISYQCI